MRSARRSSFSVEEEATALGPADVSERASHWVSEALEDETINLLMLSSKSSSSHESGAPWSSSEDPCLEPIYLSLFFRFRKPLYSFHSLFYLMTSWVMKMASGLLFLLPYKPSIAYHGE
jgi:hypothetical protein